MLMTADMNFIFFGYSVEGVTNPANILMPLQMKLWNVPAKLQVVGQSNV